MRQLKRQARREFALGLGNVIGIDRGLAMNRESGGGFLHGRSAEQVEAKIVAHDAGAKFGVVAGSVQDGLLLLELGWFHRRPVWNPQRTDAGTLVEDFGDVASMME